MTLDIECRNWWNTLFPETSPAGFLLRQAHQHRWLRIHSLPESKRYANTETEYAELLTRHNAVATHTLGQNSPCYLIEGYWVEQGMHAGEWIANLAKCDEILRFETSNLIWKSGQHDRLLCDIADCKRTNIVFGSRETNCIYAPYDGGADLIFRNEQERDERKQRYIGWLSKHPKGL